MKKGCFALLISLLFAWMPGIASAGRFFQVESVKWNQATSSFDIRVDDENVSNYIISREFKLMIMKKDYVRNQFVVMFDFGSGFDLFGGDMLIMSAQDLKRLDMKMTSIDWTVYVANKLKKEPAYEYDIYSDGRIERVK